MIIIVRSSERFHRDVGWLDTRWHFSFDDYYDAQNMGWGSLRVFNDDIVQPGGKFPMHPHANFEIITVVLSGALVHKDSEGHKGIIPADEVQVMTTGRGVQHSEAAHGSVPVHLLQIWIEPLQKGLSPGWAQHAYGPREWDGKLGPLVSGAPLSPGTPSASAGGSPKVSAPLSIHQDAVIYRSRLNGSQTISYPLSSRRAYAFVISGVLKLNNISLAAGDSAKIKDEGKLDFATPSACDFLLFDLSG